MTDKILIVGGTGFIGSNLAVNAVKCGFHTIVLSLNTPSDDKRIEGVDYLNADITDYNNLREQLLGTSFDYVVNLSGYINHSRFLNGGRKVIDVHFNGVRNLLQLINWDTLKRFIQIGSSDEYGNIPAPQHEDTRESPISPYSFGKVASTQLLQMLHRTEGFPAVILRLFLVYGPGQDNQRFLPQVIHGCLSGESFETSAGEQLRDFCYIEDITRGILQALMNDQANGEVINLASGIPIMIRDIIELVQNSIADGTPLFGMVPYRTSENMALYADISKAKKLLKWSPQIEIKKGLSQTVEYYRSIGKV